MKRLLMVLLAVLALFSAPLKVKGEEALAVDEFGCRLKPFHTCYKYEYAYRTGDLSGLEGEDLLIFEGLKGYLDYAYQFDTPYEQEKAIHDYMVLHCKYAEELYAHKLIEEDAFNYKGVFMHRQAVCKGYALAFKLCMDILGIESQLIIGKTPDQRHAWNAVKLEDGWYWVDVTWDDPIPDRPEVISYNYFNVPGWVMEKQHTTASVLENEGSAFSGDCVLYLTDKSDGGEITRMLLEHLVGVDRHTVLRVYVTKEDGGTWTNDDYKAYRDKNIGRWVTIAYDYVRSYDTAPGGELCISFQGKDYVLLEILISVVVAAVPITVIILLFKKRKKRRALRKMERQNEDLPV